MSSSYETRRDADAALAAQRELGPEYSDHIAAGLAERVEHLAAMRTAELRSDQERERFGRSLEAKSQTQRFVTALVSLGTGVPITAIAASNGDQHLLQVAICWAGIVGVNLAQALGSRRR
ncbi:MAG TPA: hypothetical protein VEQ66_06065 [Propionibacteriaceae bacterium]|nr:hypothetical protein [Propionibacteriaceae bacterium]